ncbi:MAG: hypothetical protein JST38_21220 [Bacteroidetes bacterium]|nr:hypothetical protein [Bacteroidota bacterium]
MARNNSLFTKGPAPDQARLEQYVQGRLTGAERHAVELWVEQDPLLGEAVEGLQQPGALMHLAQLKPPASGRSGPWRVPLILAALVSAGTGAWFALRSPEKPLAIQPANAAALVREPLPAAVESTLQVVHAELSAIPGKDLPVPLPNAVERFHLLPSNAPAPKRDVPGRMAARPVHLDRAAGQSEPLNTALPLESRQLVFLHGLKLVRPEDLQTARPIQLHSPGVPANVRQDGTALEPALVRRRYLEYMDGVMAAVARGDNRAALDGLYPVLDQWPDDVNAQFYAGLACYRSGLHVRAQYWFHAASANPVDSFAEEARWYAALSLMEAEGIDAAIPALDRIAREGGFYAKQAQAVVGGYETKGR